MARNTTEIDAPPEAVWRVIADGTSYSDWVVGSRAVREVESEWPRPGVRIHHTVGLGPLSWNDDTKVLEADEPRRILLEARLRPFATAHVELGFEPRDGGTRVTIDEHLCAGPLARLNPRLASVLIRGRNVETLRRLKAIAEGAAG